LGKTMNVALRILGKSDLDVLAANTLDCDIARGAEK